MIEHINCKSSQSEKGKESSEKQKITFIPLVNWTDHNNYCQQEDQDDYVAHLPSITCSAKISAKGRAFKFQKETYGPSDSKLNDGDILFCELIDHKLHAMEPLDLYVLVMRDEFLCRRFFREDRHFEFRADNPEGCHLIVSANLILEVWQVKSILKTEIPVPQALLNELQVNTYKYST